MWLPPAWLVLLPLAGSQSANRVIDPRLAWRAVARRARKKWLPAEDRARRQTTTSVSSSIAARADRRGYRIETELVFAEEGIRLREFWKI